MPKFEILHSASYWNDVRHLRDVRAARAQSHPLSGQSWRALQYQVPLITFTPQRDGPIFTVLQNDGTLRMDTGHSRIHPDSTMAPRRPHVVPATGVAARAQAILDARPSADEQLLARLAARKPKRGKETTGAPRTGKIKAVSSNTLDSRVTACLVGGEMYRPPPGYCVPSFPSPTSSWLLCFRITTAGQPPGKLWKVGVNGGAPHANTASTEARPMPMLVRADLDDGLAESQAYTAYFKWTTEAIV
ncbi:hypothetical protein DFH09DRAFT_1306512 [Mycena vulgaris]|nr:hypothetical protein DFH09DRAFT_1306512 [Mycena vulgaris]